MKPLVLLEHGGKTVSIASRSAMRAALEIERPVTVLLMGPGAAAAAHNAAAMDGVDKVLVPEGKGLDGLPAGPAAEQVRHFSHVLAAATSWGKNVLARVAALLDVAPIADVIAVADARTFRGPINAGNVIAAVHSSDAVKVITVRPTAFEPVDWILRCAEIEGVPAVDVPRRMFSRPLRHLAAIEDSAMPKTQRPSVTSSPNRRLLIGAAGGLALAIPNGARGQALSSAGAHAMNDRRDVEETLYRLMTLVDKRQWNELLTDVMMETVHVDYTALRPEPPAGPIKSAALVGEWSQRLGALLGTQHHLANVIVSIEGDDATASASGFATHLRPPAVGAAHPSMWQLGCYYDFTLKRTAAGWRIAGIKLHKQWDRTYAAA